MPFLFQISFSPQSFSLMYFDFWDSEACVSLQRSIFFTHKHSSEENQYRTGELNSWYERLNTFFPHEGTARWVLHLSQSSTYRMYVYWVCQVYSTEKYVQHHRSPEREAEHRGPLQLFSSARKRRPKLFTTPQITQKQQLSRTTVTNMKENIDFSFVRDDRC